jgi:hypothetical protein
MPESNPEKPSDLPQDEVYTPPSMTELVAALTPGVEFEPVDGVPVVLNRELANISDNPADKKQLTREEMRAIIDEFCASHPHEAIIEDEERMLDRLWKEMAMGDSSTPGQGPHRPLRLDTTDWLTGHLIEDDDSQAKDDFEDS